MMRAPALMLCLATACSLAPATPTPTDDTDAGADSDDTTGGGDTDDTTDDADDTDDTDPPAEGSVGYCHVQFPCSMTLAPGATSESVYVWVYQDGVTPGEGAGAGLEVQVGVGPDGSTPPTGWSWADATYNVETGNNDEWSGTFTAPSTAGAHDYAARARLGAGGWTYCDLGNDGNGSCGGSAAGSADGYQPAESGALTVSMP